MAKFNRIIGEVPPQERPRLMQENDWIRFSRYELLEREGKTLVIPSKDARLLHYRPHQDPMILQEYLELGKWFMDELGADENGDMTNGPVKLSHLRLGNRVLRFCSQYGLLGLLWETFDTTSCSDETDFIFTQTTDGHWKKRKFSLHASPFFPNGAPHSFKDLFDRQDELLHGYAEEALAIASSASRLYLKACTWNRFWKEKPSPTDTFMPPWLHKPISWLQFFSEISPGNVDMVVLPYPTPRIEFVTGSLFQSLNIMFALSITSLDRQLLLCTECGSPFTAKDPRAKFCGDRCSTRSRQRRFLEKHKLEKDPEKSVVKSEGEFSRKQGKTQRKPAKP